MGSPKLTRHATEQAFRRGMDPEAVQRLVGRRAHAVTQLPAAVRLARLDHYVDKGGSQGDEVWAIVGGKLASPVVITVMYRGSHQPRTFKDVVQVVA